jgi:hypothetical protein
MGSFGFCMIDLLPATLSPYRTYWKWMSSFHDWIIKIQTNRQNLLRLLYSIGIGKGGFELAKMQVLSQPNRIVSLGWGIGRLRQLKYTSAMERDWEWVESWLCSRYGD